MLDISHISPPKSIAEKISTSSTVTNYKLHSASSAVADLRCPVIHARFIEIHTHCMSPSTYNPGSLHKYLGHDYAIYVKSLTN